MLKRVHLLLVVLIGLTATSACSADGASAGASAGTPARQWVSGTDYTVIDPPVPTSTGDKVEVVEVFSYACPHCAHFQPYAEELKSKLPANAQFVLIAAVFNAQWEPFSRAFFTAQSLGLLDRTHQAVFDAVHRDHLPVNTLEALANFYAGHGANSASFLSTANSFVIDAKMSHAADLIRSYGVEATPTLVVNGKYRVSANSQRGIGFPEMVQISLQLVQQEAARSAKPKG